MNRYFIPFIMAMTFLFIAALWFLDFSIWGSSTTMYLPFPGLWGKTIDNKGSAINIAYYWLVILLIITVFGTYYFARKSNVSTI